MKDFYFISSGYFVNRNKSKDVLKSYNLLKDTRYAKEFAYMAIINQPFVGMSPLTVINYEVKYSDLYGC